MKRDLIAIGDLSDRDILRLIAQAGDIAADPKAFSRALDGALLATLFLEPSTRTRLSFEAAMLRLGGRVITSADPKTSSAAKGETLADSIRMIGAYADAIVLRHPHAGAARLAARLSPVPVVNAGDGGHEHPTQTLVDLFTLVREKGRLDGLFVVLYGDLRFGRTTHSLARALTRFGATVLALSEPGLHLPDYVLDGVRQAGGSVADVEVSGLEGLVGGRPRGTLLAPPGRAVGNATLFLAPDQVDALYVTRLQKERLPSGSGGLRALPLIDRVFLEAAPFRRAVVLHPLPRVDEIHRTLDDDPRAAYFRQAAAGVPMRMAILGAVLGAFPPLEAPPTGPAPVLDAPPCGESACIAATEPHAVPAEAFAAPDGRLRCAWCEHPLD